MFHDTGHSHDVIYALRKSSNYDDLRRINFEVPVIREVFDDCNHFQKECFVVAAAGFVLISASRGPSAIAELLVQSYYLKKVPT